MQFLQYGVSILGIHAIKAIALTEQWTCFITCVNIPHGNNWKITIPASSSTIGNVYINGGGWRVFKRLLRLCVFTFRFQRKIYGNSRWTQSLETKTRFALSMNMTGWTKKCGGGDCLAYDSYQNIYWYLRQSRHTLRNFTEHKAPFWCNPLQCCINTQELDL